MQAVIEPVTRPGSIRHLGRVCIAIDKPLRKRIRAQAAARGLTMVKYLSKLVKSDKCAL